MGCEVLDPGIVRDTAEETHAALKQSSQEADLIITCGGVSVGEEDHVHELLSNLVFGRLSSSFPFWLVSRFHSIYKSDPGNDLGQETESSQSTPVLLGALGEFEHHVHHSLAG